MSKKTDKILELARSRFKEAMDAENDNRRSSLEDQKFENGDQWDDRTQRERESAGRPCLVINKTATTVKQIVGDMRQNRPRIKVRPVDDEADPQVAELLTGLIRNIENASDAESAYDNAAECATRGGLGYFRILTDYADDDVFDQDILIERIVNPFSVYYDQSSTKTDYSDAQYCFVSETIGRKEFEAKYPKAKVGDWDKGEGEADVDWFGEDTVRVVEYWYKEPVTKNIYMLGDGRIVDTLPEGERVETEHGVFIVPQDPMAQPIQILKERSAQAEKVMWCKLCGSEVIEGPQEWPGKYIPIVPVLGEEIWIEGRRILRSAIRWAKDPQRLYNWARSLAVETIAMAPRQPWLVTPDMIEGHEEQWETANSRPQPYLLYNPSAIAPQRQAGAIPDTGALQEAMQAADDIKSTTGLFDASLGAKGNETSGKAILARQKEGDTATFVFTDNLSRALKYAGKILVDLIPKIYDTERVVRLLNQDGSEAWARINQQDPVTGQKVNDLSIGKYDVVVDVGPAYNTKRIEAADGMVQLLQAAPQYAPIILPRVAKNLDWPESDEIANEMQQMNQPQQDPKAEVELQGKQLDNQKKQLDLAKGQQDIVMGQMQGQANAQELDQRIYNIATQAVIDALQQMGA